MNRQIIKLTGLLSALVLAALANAGFQAAAQTSGGFSIRAVIPENQIDTRQTYFDLRVSPGDEQRLELVISNSRDEPLNAELSLNAASTGRNGLIVYTEPNVRDGLMKLSITDVASLERERVTVAPHSSETVAINIKMPEQSFEGVILGGVAVTGSEPGNGSTISQGVALKNKITYVTALKLTENDGVPEADFDLNDIRPKLVNFKTSIAVTLQNKSARIVKGMGVKAQVFRKGTDTVLYELLRTEAEMAPLSSGEFVIDCKNQPFSQGSYRLVMTAVYDGRTWEWDKSFTIGGEAGDLNGGAMGLVRSYTWLYALSAAAALAIVWLAAYRAGKRRRANETGA